MSIKANKINPSFWIFSLGILVLYSCSSKKEIHSSNPKKEENKNYYAKKYAQLLGVDEKEIKNKKLYSFIDSWYGTPYLYGGNNKAGVDCSGFTKNLHEEVFQKKIPRTAESQQKECENISKNQLEEGDLIFFKIESKKISHVGVYLQNHKFIHASTKKGVVISDLNQEYYKKYFYSAGRPR